jgi:tetratricopeptide (TPR) repeat protein
VRLKPDFAEAHNNLGNALARVGKLDEAIGHYEQALRIKPENAVAHYNMGDALSGLGKVREAAAQYEQALRLKPDFAEAKAALARLQAAQ